MLKLSFTQLGIVKIFNFLAIMNSNYLYLQRYMGCKLKISYFVYFFSLFSNLSLSLVLLTLRLSLFSSSLFSLTLTVTLLSSSHSLSLAIMGGSISTLSFYGHCWLWFGVSNSGGWFLFTVFVMEVVFCFFDSVVFQW